MKNFIFLTLFLVLSSLIIAQNSLLNFKEKEVMIEGILTNVVSIELVGDLSEVQKLWENYAKDKFEGKHKEKDGIFITEQTVINKITDKRGDVIVYIYNIDNKVSYNLAYKLGYDVYLNSEKYPTEFENQIDFAKHFVSVYYADILPKMIKTSKKELKNLEKQSKKSEKTIKKAEKKNIKLNKKTAKTLEKSKSDELNTIIKENDAVISAQENVIDDIEPKITLLKDNIITYTVTLEESKTRIDTF
jgi:hypothetical protein